MLIPYRDARPSLHPNAWVAPTAVITGDVEIGEGSSVWFGVVARGDVSPIRIGRETNIQDGCILHTSSDSRLTVGDRVSVGHMVVLHGCEVGDGALIGMGSIVMDGAVVGRNCIVAAGSLVTSKSRFDDGQLILGRPAKVVRAATADEIANNERRSQRYVAMALQYASREGPRGGGAR